MTRWWGWSVEATWSNFSPTALFPHRRFHQNNQNLPKNSKTFAKNQPLLEDNEEKRFLEDSG